MNAPLSSGMGRLFDAVAALLGVREEVTYEGQAAIELEQLAGEVSAKPYMWTFGDGPALVGRVQDELAEGRSRTEIAAAFHETVALAAARACAESGGLDTVALSGGTFQNLRLLGATRRDVERMASACFHIGACHRTTAGSAMARLRSQRRGARDVDVSSSRRRPTGGRRSEARAGRGAPQSGRRGRSRRPRCPNLE